MAEEPRLFFSFEEFHNSVCGWPRPNFPIDVKQNATTQGCEFKFSCHGAWSVCNCEEVFFSTRDKTDNAFTIHVLYVHNTSRRVAFRPNPCGINCCLARMLSYGRRSYCDVQIPQTNECRSCQPVVAKSRFPQIFCNDKLTIPETPSNYANNNIHCKFQRCKKTAKFATAVQCGMVKQICVCGTRQGSDKAKHCRYVGESLNHPVVQNEWAILQPSRASYPSDIPHHCAGHLNRMDWLKNSR